MRNGIVVDNELFINSDLEDAVDESLQLEYQRISESPWNIIREVCSPGWKGWQDLPAADFVEELIKWDTEFTRANRDEPFFPNILTGNYLSNEPKLDSEQFRRWFLIMYTVVAAVTPAPIYGAGNAHSEREREIRDIILWHTFDETTHVEMLRKFGKDILGFTEDELDNASNELSSRIFSQPKVDNFTRAWLDDSKKTAWLSPLAYRDGPLPLSGCAMLSERGNPWHHRRVVPALHKLHGFSKKDLGFWHVHTYIDIYHERLGMYVIGKYCITKELQDLCRSYFKDILIGSLQTSKLAYEQDFRGIENL